MKKGTVAFLSSVAGAVAGAVGSGYLGTERIRQKSEKVDKFKSYYNMLNQWLLLKQEGKNLELYFQANDYKTIAIYGMGEMGNRLYDELKNTGIDVKYAIDKNATSAYCEVEILDVEDDFEEVDVIVVTAVFAFNEIERKLSEKTSCPIISLEDVVYEI